VSSHGLDQRRVDGTHFDVVAFTNLTRDHLDYHATMEEYFAAKARLFTRAFAERAVVDIDTAWGRRMASASEVPVLTFGTSPDADVRARDVEATRDGLAFRVDGLRVAAPLLGDFNASNVLAAIAAARAAGIPEDAILHGVAAVDPVPGRAERVDAGQPFLVLVDYAHTPDGLDNVLLAAGRLVAARVVAVFGCGGDRDRAKRPMMGLAATTRADLTIVTSDNPRSEDPAGIIDDIVRGARDGGRDFVVEPDRRAAIRRAVATAREGDVVVIAGKGHESTQEIAGRAVPFDDRVVAREEIEALGDRDVGEGAS
jgi:UDP-N-acetylmuramoyl-L-alanyl-D-glutamate--2,6-diaminopimelate ligase